MDLVYENSSNLDDNLCNRILERFKGDLRKKNDTLHISRFIEWEDTVDELDEKLKNAIEEYKNFVYQKLGFRVSYLDNMKHSDGYIVKKINGLDWRSDFQKNQSDSRTITIIWYLNTRNFDGETDFMYKKIKPEKGKLLMFPASWNSFYKDHPSEDKYVVIAGLFNNK